MNGVKTTPPAAPGRQHGRRWAPWQRLAAGAAALLAVYLVGRGIVELFTVNYSDPASYRGDWGGPSLAGVLAVHSGPALAILIAAGVWLRRRVRRPGAN
jgi:hypothetical protein